MLKRIYVLSIVLLHGTLIIAGAESYYVWGGVGNDTNSGSSMTSESAWATLSHADDVVSPGDIVYVKGNFISQQRLDNANRGNGTAGNSVTYKVYDNNNVNFISTNGACNFFVTGKRYINIDGFYGSTRRMRFYNHPSGNGILAQGSGQNIDISGCVFNPAGTTYNGGYGNIQFAGNYTYIYIHNNEFRSDESKSKECIYIGSYRQRYAIDYVYIHSNIFILTGSTGVEAQALDHKAYGATHFYIYNNTFDSDIRSGYAPLSLAGAANVFGNTIDISGQTSTDRNAFFYFFYDSGYSPSAATTHIYRNNLIGGSGYEAIWLVLNDWTGLRINLYSNIVSNMSSNGGAYLFDVDKSGGSAMNAVSIYHNTFYNCALRGVLNNTNQAITITVKNNLFNTCYSYFLSDTSNMSSTWDGNYYYKSGASADTNLFVWNGTARSLSYLKSIAGQEAHGVFGSIPILDSNGKLTKSIPTLADVSVEMSGWPDYRLDYSGTLRTASWDVGAVQSTSGQRPPAPPSNLRLLPQ